MNVIMNHHHHHHHHRVYLVMRKPFLKELQDCQAIPSELFRPFRLMFTSWDDQAMLQPFPKITSWCLEEWSVSWEVS